MAFYIGISTGVYIPLTIKAAVLDQLHGVTFLFDYGSRLAQALF